jgi:hypothetical protein
VVAEDRRIQRRHRRDVHDPTAGPPRLHEPERFPQAQEAATQIHPLDPVPGLCAGVEQRQLRKDPGIVHQQPEWSDKLLPMRKTPLPHPRARRRGPLAALRIPHASATAQPAWPPRRRCRRRPPSCRPSLVPWRYRVRAHRRHRSRRRPGPRGRTSQQRCGGHDAAPFHSVGAPTVILANAVSCSSAALVAPYGGEPGSPREATGIRP